MRRIQIAALSVFMMTSTLVAGEEPRPDLSGTWAFNSAKSRLEMSAPLTSTFWIEHNEPSFKLTRTHVWDGRWDTLGLEAVTDGEARYEKTAFAESWKSVYWQGDELVLDMKLGAKGDGGTNVVHYRLEDEGKTLVAAEWFHTTGAQHHNLWVLERVSDGESAGFREQIRGFAERYTTAWGSRDPERVAGFFAENGSLTVNDGEPAVGRDAITEVARGFMTDLPDMVLFFDGLEGRGDRVRFYWTLDATNSGPGGTGQRVRVSGHETWQLDDEGLIVASQGQFPAAEYERQLEVGYDGPPAFE